MPVTTAQAMVPTLSVDAISCCDRVPMFYPLGRAGSGYPSTCRKSTITWNPLMATLPTPY